MRNALHKILRYCVPLFAIGLLAYVCDAAPAEPHAVPDLNATLSFHSSDPMLVAALPKKTHDWNGLARDTGVFMGAQFVAIGVLYVMPVEVSGWTRHDKETPIHKRWSDHTSHLVWDPDAWYINYMLHPYWGGTYYIRAHERGFGETGSFWYAFLLSALFEYGGEALFEPASLQDVIVTPVAGILVGRWFEELRAPILLKNQYDFHDKLFIWLTDPLGIASRFVERVLGTNSTLSFGALPVSRQTNGNVTLTPTLRLDIRF